MLVVCNLVDSCQFLFLILIIFTFICNEKLVSKASIALRNIFNTFSRAAILIGWWEVTVLVSREIPTGFSIVGGENNLDID